MAGYSDLLTRRYKGLLTGELKPWDLPEFKGMEYTLAKRGALARRGAGRQMRQAGIRGPAVASALRGMEESETAPLGGVMRATYGALPGEAEQWQKHMDRLELERTLGLGRLREMRKGRKFYEKEKERGAIGGLEHCVLTTACYGEDSVEVKVMRLYRDAALHHPVVQKIVRGYYIFSDLVLPLMKFNPIKSLVKHALVEPLIYALIRYEGLKVATWRMPFDSVVAYASLNLWRIMGSRGLYTRKNGEIV
jgi:hypothetical protein